IHQPGCQSQATQGRELSTLAPLRVLRDSFLNPRFDRDDVPIPVKKFLDLSLRHAIKKYPYLLSTRQISQLRPPTKKYPPIGPSWLKEHVSRRSGLGGGWRAKRGDFASGRRA